MATDSLGTKDPDLLAGGGDHALWRGFGGDDFLVFGGSTFVGQPVPVTIFGGRGADIIGGEYGDDFLYGGRGQDRISGGGGRDALFGGGGKDRFIYSTDDDSFGQDADVIGGFKPGFDRIFVYAYGHAERSISYDIATGEVSVSLDSQAPVVIAHVGAGLHLQAHDLHLVG